VPDPFDGDPAVPANPSPGLRLAMAYFDAWTSKDVDRAKPYVAADLGVRRRWDGRAPARTVATSLTRFVDILTRSQIIAAFGNDETALLLYDIATERGPGRISSARDPRMSWCVG
jgi:hypothetical protein